MNTEKLPPDVIVVVACPECQKVLRRREGKHGPFYGCSGYPDCRYLIGEQAAVKAAYEKGWYKGIEKARGGSSQSRGPEHG